MILRYRIHPLVAAILIQLLFISCLKETDLPVDVAFDFQYAENNQTVPVEIILANKTKGTDFYEWTFEGATVTTSSDKNPNSIYYNKAGLYRIKLKAWNSINSAEKEIEVRIDSALFIDFDYQIMLNDFVPANVTINNKTIGATSYEWFFEGGNPARSNSPNPGTIKYQNAGEYQIKLKVSNGSKNEEKTKTLSFRISPSPDFEIVPAAVDTDMEAPLSAVLKYNPNPDIEYKWECIGATIKETHSTNEFFIQFPNAGTYTVKLIANNKKNVQVKERKIIIKPNSGIYSFKNIKFGISEAQHSIGCFFSASQQQTLTSKEIRNLGDDNKVDVGFFGINSSFEYCYFFSPDRAQDAGFAEIPLSQSASIVNLLEKSGTAFAEQDFENIKTANDFSSLSVNTGNPQDYFESKVIPRFVLLQTADKRKGVIKVKSFVRNGIESHILTDIKIEKRKGE
ncbi:MAG: PKD domain protein [Bacteroidia bacterium]|nr:PKD domain protein [Bacteroidia bacterium]